jgi:hypothetical protein
MLKMIFTAVKTTAAAVVVLLAVTNTVSAQDRVDGAQRMTDKMKTELTLTDAQYSKVLEINKDFAAKAKETKPVTTADQKEARLERAKAVKVLNEEKEAKLKTVLTDDQYKAYLAKKEERKNKMKENRLEGKVGAEGNQRFKKQ